MSPLLSVRGISKRFDQRLPLVVNVASFEVNTGEIFALLGPSGCGKTTTLRLIAGFERPDCGEIYLSGEQLVGPKMYQPPEARGLGIVFQEYALFPHLTVFENVAFGLSRLSALKRRRRALEVLEMVELTPFKDRRPHALSGGQQQRAALARSIAPNPKLLLLDEPFSNLDAGLRQSTREEVRTLLKDAEMSAVLVTHDQEEALSFADRIAVMRDGRIEQIGAAETVYHHPLTAFVARFLGQTNLIAGEARHNGAQTPLGRLRIDRPIHGKVLLSVRPEHLVMLHHDPAGPDDRTGQITAREFKGHDLTYRVQVGRGHYFVQTDYRCAFQVGDLVRLETVEPAVVVEKQI